MPSLLESFAYNPVNWVLTAVLFHAVRTALFPEKIKIAPPKHPHVIELRTFTPKELARFDGKDGRPIYMSVDGMVFDVSRGRGFYGPGSMYENFSGRDASRGLAKNSFELDMLSPIDGPIDKLADLAPHEREALAEWKHFYLGKGSTTSAGDVLIVATIDGGLHGLDRTTGQLLWTAETEGGPLVHVASGPALVDTPLAEEHSAPQVVVPAASPRNSDDDDDRDDGGDGDGGGTASPTFVHSAEDGHEALHSRLPLQLQRGQAPPLGPTVVQGGPWDGFFVPEPAGSGDLYFLSQDGLEKFRMPLKDIVDQHSSFVKNNYAFTSSKTSILIAIDPLTGRIFKTFSSSRQNTPSDLVRVPESAVFISRTQYVLNIFSRQGDLKYNITFSEFSPSSEPELLDGAGTDPLDNTRGASTLSFNAHVSGLFSFHTRSGELVETKFSTPTVTLFGVLTDSLGNRHLTKIEAPYKPNRGAASNPVDSASDAPEGDRQIRSYIGSIDGTMYILSGRQFPHLDMSSRDDRPRLAMPDEQIAQISDSPYESAGSSDHAQGRTSSGGNGGGVVRASLAPVCAPGAENYPKCLVGDVIDSLPGHAQPRTTGSAAKGSHDGLDDMEWMLPVSITFVAFFFGALWISFGRRRLAAAKKHDGMAAHGTLLPSGVVPDQRQQPENTDHGPASDTAHLLSVSVEMSGTSEPDRDSRQAHEVLKNFAQDAQLSDVRSDSEMPRPPTPSKAAKRRKAKRDKAVREQEHPDADSPEPNTRSSASSDPQPIASTNPSSLQVLSLTDEVLGYGSHGTIVYKGYFEGREVAIKRLLIQFYDVADHEVKILQESDHHPNVVRSTREQEQCEGFMYIALELCPASLFDLVERSNLPHYDELRRCLKPKEMLSEIMAGLQHLHLMKIVHRDLKPQNILIGGPKNKKNRKPRVMISDFGLGKRLADDQSSFHNTVGFGGGTAGWRAPECLLALAHASQVSSGEPLPDDDDADWETARGGKPGALLPTFVASAAGGSRALGSNGPIRITRAVDIFSIGCVFFYVLTGGGHPFGDKFSREMNVLRGNFRLDALDVLKEESVLAKDLIKRMISKDPSKRPDAASVLRHPFFWTPLQRLTFLQEVSDRFEAESKEPPSALVKLLERGAAKVTGGDWCRRIDRSILDDLGKYRKYDGASVQDLLRALRNKKHHYQDLSASARKGLGPMPSGFLMYFETRFPHLLMHCFGVVCESRVLRADPVFEVSDQGDGGTGRRDRAAADGAAQGDGGSGTLDQGEPSGAGNRSTSPAASPTEGGPAVTDQAAKSQATVESKLEHVRSRLEYARDKVSAKLSKSSDGLGPGGQRRPAAGQPHRTNTGVFGFLGELAAELTDALGTMGGGIRLD
ncbi:bifunctional endoribonuclease/protein kinase ire1 [Polyrhizophydium stewartii]|uniref:Bifunctional endoribonuclease/protein kinase ire1 n=1 Tax=Polyrhizophydium stewartii TaxID=2732419 RepID=A0ABR4N9X7_9FUNG